VLACPADGFAVPQAELGALTHGKDAELERAQVLSRSRSSRWPTVHFNLIHTVLAPNSAHQKLCFFTFNFKFCTDGMSYQLSIMQHCTVALTVEGSDAMPGVRLGPLLDQEQLPGLGPPSDANNADIDADGMLTESTARTPIRRQSRSNAASDSYVGCGGDAERGGGRDRERAAPPVNEEPVVVDDGSGDKKRADDEVERLSAEIQVLEGLVASGRVLEEELKSGRAEIAMLQGMLTGSESRHATTQDELVRVRKELLQLKSESGNSVPKEDLLRAEEEVLRVGEKAASASAAFVEIEREVKQLRADNLLLTGETGRMARELASTAAEREEARRSQAAVEAKCETLIHQLSAMVDSQVLRAAQVELLESRTLFLQVCLHLHSDGKCPNSLAQ
jgi:hypothetical protein